MKKQIILKNISYFDVETGIMKENMNIFIENDLIKNINNSTEKYAKGSKIIDCTGKYAVPGLFESHSHLCWLTTFEESKKVEILEQFIKQGITQVRDVGGPLNVLKDLKIEINSNNIVGPEIFFAGPMLERSPLNWEKMNEKLPGFTVPINTKEDVDQIILELQENEASLVKTFNKFDKDIFKYLVQEANKVNLPVTLDPGTPLYNSIPIDLAINLGIKCIEHGKAPWPVVLKENLQKEHDDLLFTRSKPEDYMRVGKKIISLGIESISKEKLNKLAKKMVKENVYICPTLSVFADKYNETDIENEKSQIVNSVKNVTNFLCKELIKQGVKFIVGVDSCSPNTLQEMKLLQSLGLSEKEIIKGATKYPSDWLNVSDKYGSIKSKRKANILILNENPLKSIDNFEKTHLVLKDGKIVYQSLNKFR